MTCHQAQQSFADALFGELSAAEQAAFDAHLETCGECREKMSTLSAARNSLGAADAGDSRSGGTTAAFAASLYQTISSRQQRQARRWHRAALWLGGVAAAVLVVAMAGVRLEFDSSRLVISWRDADTTAAAPAAVADPWPELQRQQERLNDVSELFQLVVAELDAAERRQTAALRETQQDQRFALAELSRRVDLLRSGHQLSNLHVAALQGDVQKLQQLLTVFTASKTP